MMLHLVITVAMFLSGAGLGQDTDAQLMQSPDCVAEIQRIASDWKDQYGEDTIVAGWCEDKTLPDDRLKEMLKSHLPEGHPPLDSVPGTEPQSAPVPKARVGGRNDA